MQLQIASRAEAGLGNVQQPLVSCGHTQLVTGGDAVAAKLRSRVHKKWLMTQPPSSDVSCLHERLGVGPRLRRNLPGIFTLPQRDPKSFPCRHMSYGQKYMLMRIYLFFICQRLPQQGLEAYSKFIVLYAGIDAINGGKQVHIGVFPGVVSCGRRRESCAPRNIVACDFVGSRQLAGAASGEHRRTQWEAGVVPVMVLALVVCSCNW